MKALCDLAQSFWEDTVGAIRGALAPARPPARERGRQKASLEVEQLEGRIALSRATPLPAPALGGDLTSGLSDGSGWYLEVRKAHARHARWHWQGPFDNPTKAKAQMRHRGLAVRNQRMLTAGDADLLNLQDQLPLLPDGSPDLSQLPNLGPGGPGPGQQQYLQGYEVIGLHPVYGWIPMNPREIFTDPGSAYQDVLAREAAYYPIVYRYVGESFPADQWHVFGNRIVPNF